MQPVDRETLSQLMDGEWQDIEPSQCVKGICQDEHLRATWARYHLIRDAMKNEPVEANTDLAARIQASIQDEITYSNVSAIGGPSPTEQPRQEAVQATPVKQPIQHWRLGLSGAALAACVALATVVGLNVWQGAPGNSLTGPTVADFGGGANPVANSVANPVSGSALAVLTAVPGTVLPTVELVANRGSSFWVTSQATRQAESEMRLNTFLSQHIEHSPTADRQGMLPYSRLVGYDEIAAE